MSTRQFAIIVFPLIIFVLLSFTVFADAPSDELDDLPPVPTFKVPPEQKDEAKEQSEKVADKPADIAPVENGDEMPPIPTYTPQSKPKDEAKSESEKTDDEPEDKKRERLIKEAESGNADAAMELVKEAESSKIPAAVDQWLKVAAEAGSGEALYKLGHKAIIDNDDNTAFTSFQKAADAGYEDAKIYLAFGYMGGLGTKKDVEKGKVLLQSVADSGNATAIRKLANAYRLGIGFEKDEQKSMELLTQLYQNAKDDSTRVMAATSLCLINEKEGLKRADELLDNLDLSSLQTPESNINALFLLSGSLLEHYSRKTDNDNAIAQKRFSRLMDMFLDAGKWEISEGTIYIAIKVCEDNAIVPNSEKARLFQAMEQLANRDNPAAMLALAYLYIKGVGTEKNRYMFDYWLDKAARTDYPPAQFYAAFFLINEAAKQYITKACEANFTNAIIMSLAYCLVFKDDSSKGIEKRRIALVQSEELIDKYFKDKKENDRIEENANDETLIRSEQYSKWGLGHIDVDCSKILKHNEKKRRLGVDLFDPDNMINELWQYDYYINISDLVIIVVRYCKLHPEETSFDQQRMRELLLLAKDFGNYSAWLEIIEDYWKSDEDEKALEGLDKAMAENSPGAYLLKFKYTCYNPDGTENFDQAFPYLQKAVELNASLANKYLGMCYVLGKGVKQDVEKGVKILEDNKEYIMLMLIYGKGWGVKRDEEKSKLYYARALAKQTENDERDQFIIYETSERTFNIYIVNYEEALMSSEFDWYFNKYCLKRMEKEGNIHAAIHLGIQKKDRDVQISIFRKAAQDGNAYDVAIAGYMLHSVSGNDQRLKQETREMFLKAAQAGQSMAMISLGIQLYQDSMNESNPVTKAKLFEEGKQWFKQAADKGNMHAYLSMMASLRDSGEDIDLEEYERYLDRAIELNITIGMIGKVRLILYNAMIKNSRETPPKVIELLQRAADLGDKAAADCLRIYNNSQNDQITDDKKFCEYWNAKSNLTNGNSLFESYKEKRNSSSDLPSLQNYLPDRYNNNKNSNDLIPQLNF